MKAKLKNNIPICFQVPDAFQGLIDNIYETLKTTIENEEGVPIHHVTNMDEVCIVILIALLWEFCTDYVWIHFFAQK